MADAHKGNEATLIDYWTHGEGGQAIGWGSPGDFDRCVAEVTDKAHGKVPDVKGYCANLHHRALGKWPGQEDGGRHAHGAASHFDPAEPRDRHGRWLHVGDRVTDGKRHGHITEIRHGKNTTGGFGSASILWDGGKRPGATRTTNLEHVSDDSPEEDGGRKSHASTEVSMVGHVDPKGAWSDALHPRAPAGGPTGGQFAPGGGGTAPAKETAQSKLQQQRQKQQKDQKTAQQTAHEAHLAHLAHLAHTPTIENGARGSAVKRAQGMVAQALGYKPGQLKTDGKFGPKTEAAVKAFQRKAGLKATGILDRKTWDALEAHLAAHKPPGPMKTAKPRTGTPGTRKGPTPAPGGRPQTGPSTRAASVPPLVTIPGVDLLAVGTWELSTGRQTFTREDVANAIDAAACPAVGLPIIKLGHLDQRFTPDDPTQDAEPAIGRVMNMRPNETGTKLLGDLAGMPGWLGAIAASAFPNRSVEGAYNFPCQIGHVHPFVLSGLALLGVTPPGVGVLNGLPDIASLYGVTAAAADTYVAWRTQPQEQEGPLVPVTEEDVRRAYYAADGIPHSWWITELQMDPTQLVVSDQDGALFLVPFTIASAGVTFEPPQALESFAQLAASRGTGPVLVFASAADSRAGVEAAAGDGSTSSTGDANPGDTTSAAAATPPTLNGDDVTGDMNNAMMGHAVCGSAGSPVTHTHAHSAYGTQGGDETHAHEHTHKGDNVHDHHTGAALAASGTNQRGASEVDFTDEHTASLRTALGLGEGDDLTPDMIISATAALKARADKVAASGRLPEGVIAVDRANWDDLNKRVAAGEAFRKRQLDKERDGVIDAAIRAGKFSAARRAIYTRMWDADPENARQVLAALPSNSVPTDDLGAMGEEGGDLMDDEFKSLFPPHSVRS